MVGGDLLSHTLPSAVPSALEDLASGFGTGPGVAPPLSPPTKQPIYNTSSSHTQHNTHPTGPALHQTQPHRLLSQISDSGCDTNIVSKPLGQLVPVSSTCYQAYTSGLSTQSSPGNLNPQQGGRPHLGTGFPLRCFQRLSLPNIANQPCPWQNNWHTRGSSVPVLSY